MSDPQDLIKQATAICEAATPGPWGVIDDYDGVASHHGWRSVTCPGGHGGHGGAGLVFATHEWDVGLKEVDIEFIAAARTLVPALAAELERSLMAHQMTIDTKLFSRRKLESDVVTLARERDESMDEASDAKSLIRELRAHKAELTRERDEARAELKDLHENYNVSVRS